MSEKKLTLNVNGQEYIFVLGTEVSPTDSLSTVLRNKIGLTGVRVSCEQGACGACTILLDGKSALSCMTLAVEAEGHKIRTIEDFDENDDIVKSFIETSEPGYGTAMQCGFCTPGFVLESHSFLAENPNPTNEEIKEGLSGHICRCGCYHGIERAVAKCAVQRNNARGEIAACKITDKEPYTPRVPGMYIGTYGPKSDAKEKVMGKVLYLDDKTLPGKLPGMLYAKILNSPYANAKIVKMDTGKAEALKGVHCVLRYDDPEILALKPTTHAWTDTSITPYERDVIDRYWERKFLEDRARWVGDQMGVAVAAETPELACEAMKLIDIEWEVYDFVLETEAAKEAGAPVLHERLDSDSNKLKFKNEMTDDLFFSRGDCEAGMKEADFVLEADRTYGGNSLHGTLDSRGCVIKWDEDELTCWTNHYCYDQNRLYLHEFLGVPLNRIRVYNGNSGASMGKWNTGEDVFYIITAIMAKRSGRPVRYKMDSHEEFHDSRTETRFGIKAGIKNDGTVTALRINGVANAGGYMNGADIDVSFQMRDTMERMLSPVKNVEVYSSVYFTSRMPGGVVRAVGNIQHCYAFMHLFDLIAEKLNMDPIDVIIKNCGNDWVDYPDKSLIAVLKEGAKRIGWEKRHKAGQGPGYEGSKKRGLGIAAWNTWHPEWTENDRGHIEVGIRLNPDMSVHLQAQTSETGAGANSAIVLACAESLSFLNIRPHDIKLMSDGDSYTGFRDSPPTGSAVSVLYAEALHEAAEKVKSQVKERAGYFLGMPPDELDVEDGMVFAVSDTSNRVSVNYVMMKIGDCVPIYTYHVRDNNKEAKGMSYSAWFAEVEVDTELGDVEVLNLVLVTDAGKVLYASGAEGQQLGGQCMGLGESLMEEIIYDKKTGTMLNNNLIDYKIPVSSDYPDIDAWLMEIWKGGG